MSKPIAVIYFPDNFVAGGMDRSWVYEYMRALNGESPTNNKWDLSHDYSDYHWFCFYKDEITEPEFHIFFEKDFTPIQYEELRKIVYDSLKLVEK